MGGILHFLSWGVALQAMCLIHWLRRRPDTFWIWIIVFFGPVGAAVYFVMEVVPDLALLRASMQRYSRKRRIAVLEGLVQVNPAVGNREELADLLLEEGHCARAREIYNDIISPRTESTDLYYRRGLSAMGLNDPAAAVPDLERVVAAEPKYDFYRAMGQLAHAYALTGQSDRAEHYFQAATEMSTLSETFINYARFLIDSGRVAEGRAWAKKVVDKQLTLPRYLRRRERPWVKKAKSLAKQGPIVPSGNVPNRRS